MSDAVPSPCILVCQLDHKTGWCLGCGRTGAEIMAWPSATKAEQRKVLSSLPERMEAMGLPPGGDQQIAETRATAQRNRKF